jgi:hypothetical protein
MRAKALIADLGHWDPNNVWETSVHCLTMDRAVDEIFIMYKLFKVIKAWIEE